MPADLVAADLDLARVHAGPDRRRRSPRASSPIAWAQRIARAGPVEGREEPVAGRVDLAAAEAGELAPDDLRRADRAGPATGVSPSSAARGGRADDVGEQHGREHAVRIRRGAAPVRNSSISSTTSSPSLGEPQVIGAVDLHVAWRRDRGRRRSDSSPRGRRGCRSAATRAWAPGPRAGRRRSASTSRKKCATAPGATARVRGRPAAA